MAAGILSQDLIALFLFMCNADMSTNMSDVVSILEDFQEKHDRHFGTDRGDLTLLLFMEFGRDKNGRLQRSEDLMWEQLHTVSLKAAIDQVLNYSEAYFNDEGAYFIKEEDIGEMDISFISAMYGYNESQFAARIKFKVAIKELLQNEEINNPQFVMDFLREHGVDQNLLLHCSRPGASS